MKKYLFIAAVGMVMFGTSCKTTCPAYSKVDTKAQPVAKTAEASVRG